MTDELVAHVQHQEGCRLKAYLDQIGLPTQGWGHRVPSLNVPDITQARADQMLREDIHTAEESALDLCPNLAKYPRRLAALTDLVFNAGKANVQQKGTHTLAAFRAENWPLAAQLYRQWNTAGGKVLPVLARRREVCARWIEEGL